jgi:glucosyl-3-phosphoglycerate synthase
MAGNFSVVKAYWTTMAVMGPLRFDRRAFSPAAVAAAKGGRTVSVCLPARDEAATVGTIAARIAALDVVDEVLVVDDGSTDATGETASAAGAMVVTSRNGAGQQAGKGGALWTAVGAARGDVLVFCDADLVDFDPSFVTGLLGPVLTDERVAFAKGTYARPGDGGRVTELVARPLISLLFPHLAGFGQPLGGELAAHRWVLEAVPFVAGYGVDIALLVDVAALVGLEAMAEVDLGERRHRNRPLSELRPQAQEVMAAAFSRAGVGGPVPEHPPRGARRDERAGR